MDSLLRPRDIQSRIRSGESPETVAAAAQTSLERVMVFAGPVLAERAYVAQQAQRASVRRRTGEGVLGAPGQLGDAVAARLETQDVDPEAVEWDAWRRDDGRWSLVAEYPAPAGAGRSERAEFLYDADGRYVTATDEQSRWLVGERVGAGAAGPAGADAPAADDASQLHLGDDAIELVTGRRPAPPVERPDPLAAILGHPVAEAPPANTASTASTAATTGTTATENVPPAPEETTVDLTEPAAAVRPLRSVRPLRPAEPEADAGWIATQATARPAAPARTPAAAEPAETPENPEPVETPEPAGTAEPEGLFEAPTEPAAAEPAAARKAAGTKRGKGRAAIPSWDEIMFGSPGE